MVVAEVKSCDMVGIEGVYRNAAVSRAQQAGRAARREFAIGAPRAAFSDSG